MLSYFNPFAGGDKILSIDNVVLTGHIPDPRDRDRLMDAMNEVHFLLDVNVSHWNGYKIGAYHEQFKLTLANGNSFWLGVGLNQVRTDWGQVCLDFNPNKVADTDVFRFVHGFLLGHTREASRKIKRFDLAIDIPVPREKCHLVKDNRVYSERRHGREWTQYLGAKSSHVGRVKLYNKAAEAKLDEPLTRLELTLDPAMPYEKITFPKVYYLNDMQTTLDDMKVTDTDNFILSALLQGVGSTQMLGRRERAKIEQLMQHYIAEVHVSLEEYAAILQQLENYVRR